MIEKARCWRVLAGGVAAGFAGVLGFAGATATAEPVFPLPPVPGPATVTQTVTVAPGASAAAAPVAASGVAPVAGTAQPLPSTAASAIPAAAPATLVPATSVTLTDFLKEKGVALEPQTSREFTALTIVLPIPRGWSQVPDPNVPDAFAVIADRVGGNGLYTSNAQVKVYKLIGDFDPKEAITHGFIESQLLPAWRSTNASLADYGGMPSALIEGTYRENSMTLNTYRRHVIATAGPDKYLVSLALTTSVDQAVPAADATDAIARGFKVTPPNPVSPAPPPPGLPAVAGLPSLPGLTPGNPG